MDSYLSDFLSTNSQIKVVQPRSIYYKKYNTRLRLKVPAFNHSIGQFLYHVNSLPNVRIRVESKKISIFFEYSKELFSQLVQMLEDEKYRHLNKLVFEYFYELSIDTLNLNKRTVRSPRMKKYGFDYRIHIKNGHRFSIAEKENLSAIIKNNPDQFNVPDSTNRWLNNKFVYSFSSRYFYVKENSILTLVHLSCSNLIGQVVEII